MAPVSRARDVKVGLFVLVGFILSGLVIFLIGDERRLFQSAVTFKTHFADVQGLKDGAPIRMGGIDIGHVESVGYGKDAKDATIYVKLSVVKTEAGRIRSDSTVKIVTKGLLGDKMVEITKGTQGDSVPFGGEIKAEEPEDIMGMVNGMASKAELTLEKIQSATTSFADEGLHRDLRGSMASLRVVLDQVASGPGYPHKFLTDPEEAERISRTIAGLDRAASELSTTLAEVRHVVARVKQGPGFTHDVIYGDGPKAEVAQFGAAAEEIATMLKGVRQSDSFAHGMLYGGEGQGVDALGNVTAMTSDLRAIVADARSGKGTLGALLVDPSVYEDLKAILGNVQRNDVLRALVRYSIKQDEKKPRIKVEAAAEQK